jgi:YidC/Oxa1 family membrane protein insertase
MRRHASNANATNGTPSPSSSSPLFEKRASVGSGVDADSVVSKSIAELNDDGGVAATAAAAATTPLSGERVSVLVQGVTVNLDECWANTRAFIQLFEALHDTTMLPWSATLVAFVVLLRTATLPFVVSNLRNSLKMQAQAPLMADFQARMKTASTKEENLAIRMKMIDTMRQSGASPWRPFLFILIQMPLFFTAFRAQTLLIPLHADEMATAGMLWFTNLAYTDATFALPIISSAIMLLSMELGAEGVGEKHRALFRNLMRGLAVITVPLLSFLPAGSLLFILAHNVYSLGWSLLMRVPAFRTLLGLSPIPPKITLATPSVVAAPAAAPKARFFNAESGKLEERPVEESKRQP